MEGWWNKITFADNMDHTRSIGFGRLYIQTPLFEVWQAVREADRKKSELGSPPLEPKKWEYLYRCKYCGYEWTEEETEYLPPSP